MILDPAEELVEGAVSIALTALARRDHTRSQIEQKLTQKGYAAATVSGAITRLAEMGYLDDRAYARRFTEDKRNLEGWGARRIAARLSELGVDRETVDEALADESRDEEIERAVALLAQRFSDGIDGNAAYNRAIGMLVRRGYVPELASDAIRQFKSTLN